MAISFDVKNAIASGGNLARSEMDRTSITISDVMSTWYVFKQIQQLPTGMTDGTLKHEDLLTSPSIKGIQCKLTVWEKNINLTGHPGYSFSTEWKGHLQKCRQPYQGRTSPVCLSHITLSGRNDKDEERRARELDQACQETCHQAQL